MHFASLDAVSHGDHHPFWKDQIGLSLTQILLLQSIFSAATVLLEYPSGYISDRLGYRTALTIATRARYGGVGDSIPWPTPLPRSSLPRSCSASPCRSSAVPTAPCSSRPCGRKGGGALRALRGADERLRPGRARPSGALFAGLLYASAPCCPSSFRWRSGCWLFPWFAP
ncbi:MAG: hypothetical protein M0C28_21615 [Candidatus Moduliflexus flocculans]|nr:hypothetical protein [Candidatus Moduliflexus flocculans]